MTGKEKEMADKGITTGMKEAHMDECTMKDCERGFKKMAGMHKDTMGKGEE